MNDMERINILTQEIIDKIKELEDISNELASLPPKNHKSKSFIQWQGGILGAIQESRENNRLIKLINEPLVNGVNFGDIATFLIPQSTEYLVERQIKIQQLVSKEDKRYYGLVIDIFNIIHKLTITWYNYSPDMANAYVNGLPLALHISIKTKELITKMDLPKNVAEYYAEQENKARNSDGCLASIPIILLATIATLGISCYNLYKLII